MTLDHGLQPERTELAWRRTVLASAVGALVSVRVLPAVLGDWTVATGLAGVVAAGGLWIAARRRADRVTAVFDGEPGALLPGGVLPAVTALLAALGAALGLVYVAAAVVAG